jgi:REP element-mobilizing transposase RayT
MTDDQHAKDNDKEMKRQDAASTFLHRFFDPSQPVADLRGNLPHWRQDGVTYFVTFRLADSLPQVKLDQWITERETWLAKHRPPFDEATETEYHRLFSERMQDWLDAGYGACELARQDAKDIVERALRHFNRDRYVLGEFVVMPNHVHVVVSPLGQWELTQILHSWKSYTANAINRALGKTGPLWQKESFDHIVRNAYQLDRISQYIRDNPKKVEAASSRFNPQS